MSYSITPSSTSKFPQEGQDGGKERRKKESKLKDLLPKEHPKFLKDIIIRDKLIPNEKFQATMSGIYPMTGTPSEENIDRTKLLGKFLHIRHQHGRTPKNFLFLVTGKFEDPQFTINSHPPVTLQGRGYYIHETNPAGRIKFGDLLVHENPLFNSDKKGEYIATFDGKSYNGTFGMSKLGPFDTGKAREADKRDLGTKTPTLNPDLLNARHEREKAEEERKAYQNSTQTQKIKNLVNYYLHNAEKKVVVFSQVIFEMN